MSKKQVIVLWIIALALVGTLAIVNASKSDGFQSATERKRGETLLVDFDPTKVTSLSIKEGTEVVTLQKKEGKWTVAERDDYPANTSSINELLRLIDEVEVTQGIEADPEFAPRFGMDSEATDPKQQGTVVVMTDGNSELAHLTFGKNLESASNLGNPFMGGGSTGRFVKNHQDDSGVYVTSELFPTLNADPSSWLDDDFLIVEKIQSIAVSKQGKLDEHEWKITREGEGAPFTLIGKKDNENLDTNALNPLGNLFSYARFEDIIPAAEEEGSWIKDERQQAVIETFEGLTYHVTFGPQLNAADKYLLRVTVAGNIPEKRKVEEGETEDDAKAKDAAFTKRRKLLLDKLEIAKRLEGRTYQVSKFTVDPLLKNRTGLIKSAPPAASNNPPTPRGPARAVSPPIAIPPQPTTPPSDGEE